MYLFSRKTLFLAIAFIMSTFLVYADQIIENFEPPNDSWRLTSYPGQDLQPDYWRFDSTQGAAGTSNSFYMYGNTWKIYDISDKNITISDKSVWEVYAKIPSTATVTAFGLTDGVHEVIYSLEAFETPYFNDSWILTYTGWKYTSASFQRFKLPVGRDFDDRYGPLFNHQITGIILINDEDTSNGTVYFDQIKDITDSEPHAPIAYIGDDLTVNVGQGINFVSEITDPDSSVFDYHWDFGDGNTNSSANPWHAFVSPGVYNVLLTVEDPTGLIGMDSLHVTVGQNPFEPVASLLFTGDVMFGRRFEDPDDTTPLINPGDQGSGAKYVGSFTRGFSSDLKIINLESPMTDEGLQVLRNAEQE